MPRPWMWAVSILGGAASFAACATQASDSGSSGPAGTGGATGSGGAAEASSSSAATTSSVASSSASSAESASSSSSGTGGASLCGNGQLDPGEACDGKEFGGKTCQTFGLGSGQLECNDFCGIVVSTCVPKES